MDASKLATLEALVAITLLAFVPLVAATLIRPLAATARSRARH